MLTIAKRILTAPLTRSRVKPIRHESATGPSATAWRPCIEPLEDRAVPATVVTDQEDYFVGETACFHAAGYLTGETVRFQVLHVDDPSLNNDPAHDPFYVADGGVNDLDGRDGVVKTSWYVDATSAGATFELTATGMTSGEVATITFTDSNVPAPTFIYAAALSITPPVVDLNWQNNVGAGGVAVIHIEKALINPTTGALLSPWMGVATPLAGGNNTFQTYTDGSDNAWVSIDGDDNPLHYAYRLFVERQTPGQASQNSTFSTTIPVTPRMTITDVTQSEGDSGTTLFTFTVNLSVPGIQTATVSYSTANGTATTDSSDYTFVSGLLTFLPDDTSETLTVSVTGDGDFEPDETFFVNLSGATNASLTDNQGLGTIVNDDTGVPVLTNPGDKNVDELATLSFTLSATDPDTDLLTYSITIGVLPGMILDPSTGVFSWTPSEVQDGIHSVTFTASDGTDSDSETILITVNEVNTAPTLSGVPTEATIPELVLYTFTATASDPDLVAGVPNTRTFSLLGAPEGATINPITGEFSWTPGEDQDAGDYTFTVRVNDGTVNTDQQVTLHVTEVNTPPTLSTGATIPELAPYTFTATASDPDLVGGVPNTLTFSLLDEPDGANIDPTTGEFSWTPSEDQGAGDYTFTVRVNDGTVNTDQLVTLQVTEVNQAPTLEPIVVPAVDEGTLVTFTAVGADADTGTGALNALTYSLLGAPVGATIDPDTGEFNWTPGEADGSATFTVRVSDSELHADQTVTITVNEVNTAPTLSGVPTEATIPELAPYTFTATASDPDLVGGAPNTRTFSLLGAPEGAAINPSTGVFGWTPSEVQGAGVYTFTVRVNDGTVNTDQTVIITVNEVNTAPTLAVLPNQVVSAGAVVVFTAVGTDADTGLGALNTLTYSLVGAPTGASIDPNTGAFSWATTPADAPGTYTFAVNVSDGSLLAQQSVTISVNSVLDPPVSVQAITEVNAVGAYEGAGPHVLVYNAATGSVLQSYFAFPGFPGGVSVATGDLNGDGFEDVIVGAGDGATTGGHVKAFDGATGGELYSFFAFPGFTGGVFVGAGDVNGDGSADIIVGARAGASGGHVKVFDGVSGAEIRSFFAFLGYTGDARVAGGDVNNDGLADIVVGTGLGSSHVKVFDGATGGELRSFFAFPGYTGGVFVGAGDLNGDGFAELVVGAAAGATGGHVKTYDGDTGAETRSFFAFPGFTGGVTVAAGTAEFLVGAGPGAGPHVKVFDGPTGAETQSFFAFDQAFVGGVFVG